MTGPRVAGRLFILLLAIGVYRLTLLDRGATAFVDETLYFTSVMALQALGDGDVQGAFAQIPVARGRQGAAIIQLPVAAVQAIPFAFGVPASNPRSLLIPTVFNVVISLVTLYLFFHICQVLCGDGWAAATASVVYALLVNTNLYVRHLLPYDWALCAGVCAIWLAVTRPRTAWLAAATGSLAAAVITIYSGYYLLAAVLGFAIVGQGWSDGWRRVSRFGSIFAAAAVAVIAAIELVSRAGGVSYIASSRTLSRTITMGAFEEGWTFLPAYLFQVEGLSGVVLLVATASWLWRAASGLRRRTLRPIDWLLFSALAGWAWQAAASAQWHSIVLYGRLIHPWMLFMALALADSIAAISGATVRRAACAVVVAGAVMSWAPSAWAYYRLAYPPDVLYALGIDTTRVPPERMLCELQSGTSYASPAPLDRVTRHPYTDESNYLLVNFCQGAPSYPRLTGFEIDGSERLYDGPHWLTFPAYGFEGFTPATRDDMTRNGYRVRAFRLPASAGPIP